MKEIHASLKADVYIHKKKKKNSAFTHENVTAMILGWLTGHCYIVAEVI